MKFINNTYSYIVYVLFSLTCSYLNAQNETNNWYFGDFAGFNFNSGQFSIIDNGRMSTPAGCSSISDLNGELLFYTNGQTVWNKNHDIMTNGTGLNAEIDNNQTSIIIPDPTNDYIYFILTTRVNESDGGIYYSRVEFNQENPFGFVSSKNVMITASSTERITAIHTPETNTIKAVGLGKESTSDENIYNALFVINIGVRGIFPSTNPALVNTFIIEQSLSNTLGTIRFSPNGRYLAVGDNGGGFSKICLYSFNTIDNTFEHLQTINSGYIFTPISVEGLDFSADSEILYFSGNFGSTAFLHKYFINSSNPIKEKILIHTSQDTRFGNLQLASNSKIYMANYTEDDPYIYSSLSVINYPEEQEDIEYEPLGITLSNSHSTKGLPNFITSYFRNRIIVQNKCVSETFDFTLDAYDTITDANWDFGDGNFSTSLNPKHQYDQAGNYIVKAEVKVGEKWVKLFKEVKVYSIPEIENPLTISQCDVDNDGISIFNLLQINNNLQSGLLTDQNQFQFYHSKQEAENGINAITNPSSYENISNPQQIFVRITSEYGCDNIDSFFIEVQNQSLVKIPTFFTCEASDNILNNNIGLFDLYQKSQDIAEQFNVSDIRNIRFYLTLEDALTDPYRLNYRHESESTTLWIRIRDSDNTCGTIAQMDIVVNQPLQLNIEDEYQLCELLPNPVLDGGISNDSWEWTDESGNILSTRRLFTISNSGNYQVTATKEQNGLACSVSKSFSVKAVNMPTFDTISIDGTTLSISINGTSDYEYSLNNQDFFGSGIQQTFYNVNPGVIDVFVRDKYNCEKPIQSQVSFIYFPKFFTPNGDNINDNWTIYGINDNLYENVQVKIYNRYGKQLFSMDLSTINYGWNGTFNNTLLPNSDYWYIAKLVTKDKVVIDKSGHFSLKR